MLYTDGLVDFPEAADNELDRVMRRAARLVDNPVSLVAEALVSAAPAYDDAAVLVARVSAARISPAQRTFPAQPISAGIARTWVSDLFDLWTSPADAVPVTDDQRDTAALLLTELVSNAVRHSDQSFRAQVELTDRRLRVEVEDTSERMPVLRQPEAAATEGRGLRLVDTLATSWGAQLEEQGKVVWFEMDLDGRGTERRPAGPGRVRLERLDQDERVAAPVVDRALAARAGPPGLRGRSRARRTSAGCAWSARRAG